MSRYAATVEDDEEEKQSCRPSSAAAAATAASSSSSSRAMSIPSSSIQSGFRSVALAHLTADPDNDADRKMISQITVDSFCDLRYCHEHGVIGEAVPLLGEAKSSYKQCTICPSRVKVVDGSVITLQLQRGQMPHTLADLEAVHKEWVDASFALRNERIARDAQRMRSSADLASARDNPLIVTRERDSWTVYTLVVFDVVRPHLIAKYGLMRRGELVRTRVTCPVTATNLLAYERYLSTYIMEFNTRALTITGGQRDAEHVGTPRLWCFAHKRAGHMFPTGKARGYNPACWVCIADDASHAPKDKLTESRGFADLTVFNRMCGISTTLVNKVNTRGGASASSRATASSSSSSSSMMDDE